MTLTAENILLIGSVLLFIFLFWERISHKFEVPVLVIVLIIGMLAGSEGIGKIPFDNHNTAYFVGMIALVVILFSGGMDAKYQEIKPIMIPSILLSTIGVLITAIVTGLFIYWVISMFFDVHSLSLIESFLLASVVASTDFALVFAILHSKGLKLKHNLGPLLEFESGSNDVMAYLLMITFLQIVQHVNSDAPAVVGMFFYELIVGALCGFIFGRLAVKTINKVAMSNDALYPIFLLAIMFIIFLITGIIKGNGFLAVYIGGLTIGNSQFLHKRSSKNFFDGFAWLAQILMFFTFGMLVNPSELLPVAGLGITIGLFLIFIARPVSVLGCIFPFKRIPVKAKMYVSWVGLRGAVPLIFATCIMASGIENAGTIFNIVFFVMIISLLVQGSTVPFVARFLGLVEKAESEKNLSALEREFSNDLKSAMAKISIRKEHLIKGNSLIKMQIPENTIVVMIQRGTRYFVPKGNTKIKERDVLFVISDNKKTLKETYKKMGIN